MVFWYQIQEQERRRLEIAAGKPSRRHDYRFSVFSATAIVVTSISEPRSIVVPRLSPSPLLSFSPSHSGYVNEGVVEGSPFCVLGTILENGIALDIFCSIFSLSTVESFPLLSKAHIPSQATSGLGLATACELSKEGYVVVIVGRSEKVLSETTRRIKGWNKDAQLKAFQADLSSIESIIKFKKSLHQWLLVSDLHCSIQILINNAGILATSRRVTAEGYDQMMGTNYIAAFVLTKLLLPLLESSPISSKIVNVTSFTHRAVIDMQVDQRTVSGKRFFSSKQYPYARIYEYSKFCLLLFSYELHRQLCLMDKSHQIFVTVADPGVVQTNIMREVPASLSCLAFCVLKRLRLLQSPECGSGPIIDAALAPPGASGAYFFGGKGRTINSSRLSRNAKLARELWETTCNLLSMTPFGFERNSF